MLLILYFSARVEVLTREGSGSDDRLTLDVRHMPWTKVGKKVSVSVDPLSRTEYQVIHPDLRRRKSLKQYVREKRQEEEEEVVDEQEKEEEVEEIEEELENTDEELQERDIEIDISGDPRLPIFPVALDEALGIDLGPDFPTVPGIPLPEVLL